MNSKRTIFQQHRRFYHILAGFLMFSLGFGMLPAGGAYLLIELCPTARAHERLPSPSSENGQNKGVVAMAPPGAGTLPALIKKQTFFSVRKRLIEVYEFGVGERCTLVIGGVHGNETAGVVLARALLNYLRPLSIADFEGRVVLIPVANPDGFKASTRRNANQIDINRNFPTRNFRSHRLARRYNPGRLAASEPETRAILKVADEYHPDLIITFHGDLNCVNYDGPGAEVAARIGAGNGMPVMADLGYDTPGSLGTYFGRERNIPVITLELWPKDDQWSRHGKAILAEIGVKVHS